VTDERQPPMRGRSTRERRLAEKVAREWADRRAATARAAAEGAVDFDTAEVDAEVADLSAAGERAERAAARPPASPPSAADGSVPVRSARRLPDLSALPRLLADSGAFAALRERIGSVDEVPGPRDGRGRHAGITALPHGAKTYLASALVLGAGERALVPTGLAIALPPGHEGQVRPRSGLASKQGVTVLNAPGTIDEDYRGELKVLLVNSSRESYAIQPFDRIAQLVVAPVTRVGVELVQDEAALGGTERGQAGFGSSGR